MEQNKKYRKRNKPTNYHDEYQFALDACRKKKSSKILKKSKELSAKGRSLSKESCCIQPLLTNSKVKFSTTAKLKTDRTRSCSNPGKKINHAIENSSTKRFEWMGMSQQQKAILCRCEQVLNSYQLKFYELQQENQKLRKENLKLANRSSLGKSYRNN